MVTIELAGETVQLSPERAMIWPARRTVIVADPHFGKGATFRSAGIPVPEGATAADLHRLSTVLTAADATRLIVLGDFFHARQGRCETTLGLIEAWRKNHADLEILLVRGNHDIKAGDPPAGWDVRCIDERTEGPFVMRHEPTPDRKGYVLAGHLHPAIWVGELGGAEKAPCYWFGSQIGVLPAFGSFTGTRAVRRQRGDRVFAVGPGAVVAWPSAAE